MHFNAAKRALGAVLILLFSLLLISSAQASLLGIFSSSGKQHPLPVEQAFKLQVDLPNSGVLRLNWAIEDEYYLYRDHLKIDLPEGLELVAQQIPGGEQKDDSLFGNVTVWYQAATAQFLIGTDGRDLKDAMVTITYQGCWEGGICYAPERETIPLTALPLAAGLSWPDGMAQVTDSSDIQSSAPAAAPVTPVAEHDRFSQLLAGKGLLLILTAFFVAGLALSFTPCVFPMIPILSSIIAGHGMRITTGRAFGLSLVYVLAMALTYTVAGVLAGLFGSNIQASFQNPWVIGVFSAIFVLLALSMFGFYELQLPSALQTRFNRASQEQRGGHVTGVAVMGFLSALIVGPCMAAPLAGALIYIGQTGDPVLGGAALFSMSMGMGVPLLLVGASAGKLLPKAGAWMNAIKAGFGVSLLLMAVWMLDRVVSIQVTMALTSVILLVTAVYLNTLDRLHDKVSGWHKLWKGVGVISMIYGAALMVGLLSGGNSMLYPLQGLAGPSASERQTTSLPFNTVYTSDELDAQLAVAERNGQSSMLYFTADWCVTCAELDFITFADAQVQSRLGQVNLIKVDITANDDKAKALSQRYNVFGPPALIFYDSQGERRPELTVYGVIRPAGLLNQIAGL
ncbi:protein-disulfide reductase DsbD [Nitrincola alkalilacustris]|uniref:protein-disulfide reductase DsbD n=1 Tax=Nitrincola alkalilacustris TaxID=1571224 RepID=UPI00124F601F|nr:protein-disulfide reductase DsbD [Nitrincola alkalilacustris]